MMHVPAPQAFSVRRAHWERDNEQLRRVRRKVFVEEQAVPEDLEWDGRDTSALHVIATDSDARPIGAARLLPTGQIGRMAVTMEWRGRGVGTAMLRTLLVLAHEHDCPPLFLNAQASAILFYRKNGFRTVGEAFAEAGILHHRMVPDEGRRAPAG